MENNSWNVLRKIIAKDKSDIVYNRKSNQDERR